MGTMLGVGWLTTSALAQGSVQLQMLELASISRPPVPNEPSNSAAGKGPKLAAGIVLLIVSDVFSPTA